MDGRYFFERPVSEYAKLSPHTASRALFNKGHKIASDMFLKKMLPSAMGRAFLLKRSFLHGKDAILRRQGGVE